MLTHSDPETQLIFALLEKQRDDAVIEAGRQAAKAKALEDKLAASQETPIEESIGDASN